MVDNFMSIQNDFFVNKTKRRQKSGIGLNNKEQKVVDSNNAFDILSKRTPKSE